MGDKIAIDTYLLLIKQELDALNNLVSMKNDLYFDILLGNTEEVEDYRNITEQIEDSIKKVSFYESQLTNLGFYDEPSNQKILNQTLTGNC